SIFWDFKGVMDKKGVTGELAADAVKPVVEMDRYLYERVLFNLLSNAVKFTPPGGKVSVGLEVFDGKLTLSVSDTGIGISEKDQAKLFEKFYQAEGSSTRRFEGTGLGLALVKEFSHLLGGDVTVASEPGKGSRFTLTCLAPETKEEPQFLPEPKPKSSTATMAAPPALGPHAEGESWLGQGSGRDSSSPKPDLASEDSPDKPKVLVAEDNPELSAFLASLLSPLANVRAAADGGEALELARSWGPDLVLSDVMMPQVDGIQLTRELKRNPETATIPVVLLTAMTNREGLMRGWEAGADDYLFKPFHPKELEARVKSLLAGLNWRRKGEAYKRQRDALEHFTHIASHDLREPLRKITTFVSLFKEDQLGLPEESSRYLDAISRAAGRMTRLLDSLIEYARLEDHREAYQRSPLSEVVREALGGLELGDAEVEVGDLPALEVHPGQMEVVFLNLIGNALKYRREGVAPRVRVGAERRDFEWVFSVSDNGMGFDGEMSERIFIMFERLHGQDRIPGEGMGLAICRRIIENHGGRIWAESAIGRGSTFYFTLLADREGAARTL
ncbi:MAG TPA: ATP-binding protein, partial [bacterium]|nr:ATP-binding protein [bacterium]